MTSGRRSVRAFTLVEILVIVAIVGVLIGLLLPALGAARNRARKSTELSHLRQVGLAWQMYANHHNDSVLPGYLETAAQEKWRVRYEYQDHELIPPAPNYSGSDPNIAGPWTWRLLPFLDYSHDVVHGYRGEAQTDFTAMIAEAEEIANTPAFGYNAYYVGGWMDLVDKYGGSSRVVPRFGLATNPDSPGRILNLVVNSIGEFRRPADMLVFCSSARRESREFRRVPDNIDGSHFVVPPVLARSEMWRLPSNIANATQSLVESVGEIDGQSAPIPIGRYTGAAAVLYADGHTDNQTAPGLIDQRIWINIADDRHYTHPDWTP